MLPYNQKDKTTKEEAPVEKYFKFELRAIDAWGDPEGHWVWNNSYVLADDLVFHESALTPRKLLKALRNWGYLSQESKGRVRVIDEGDLIEIQEKNTGMPLLALLLCDEYSAR